MLDVNQYYKSESDYLKAEDIPLGKQYAMTIKAIEGVEFDNNQKKEVKLVATFHETEKKLVLNKTNAMMISSMYGPDADQWPGSSILLYQTKVQFGNDMVDAIRVDLPRETVSVAPTNPAPQQTTPAQNFDNFDDDIPF